MKPRPLAFLVKIQMATVMATSQTGMPLRWCNEISKDLKSSFKGFLVLGENFQ